MKCGQNRHLLKALLNVVGVENSRSKITQCFVSFVFPMQVIFVYMKNILYFCLIRCSVFPNHLGSICLFRLAVFFYRFLPPFTKHIADNVE